MSGFLYTKTQPFLKYLGDSMTYLGFLESSPIIIMVKSFSSSIRKPKKLENDTSFTVSYLISSCGLSPEDAKSASKRLHFINQERADAFLALLKKHNLSDTQISKVVKSFPQLLLVDPDNVVLPKLEFFSSVVGLTGPNLARFISVNPGVLSCSLTNTIIPAYNFIKTALLFDDDLVIRALRYSSRLFQQDVEKVTAPNLLTLLEIGMPKSFVSQLLIHYPSILCCEVNKFKEKVKIVINMGFCTTKIKFIQALAVLIRLTESSWQQKIQVYRRCGWSKDEIESAFRKQPLCMSLSEKKIIGNMDFFVNVMDLKASLVAVNPYILLFSLKKRIIPRGSVIKILLLEGVLKKDIHFYYVLKLREDCFLEMFVNKHQERIPHLLGIYHGRVSLKDLGYQ